MGIYISLLAIIIILLSIVPLGCKEEIKEPIDYRRNGVITIFVGAGLFFLGYFFVGNVLKGVGALVGLIGVGTMIAGYLYPNTEKELPGI